MLGQAYVSGICSRYAASFSVDMINSAVQVGATMAHEIGHLLGLPHDRANCSCPYASLRSDVTKVTESSTCIMVSAKSVTGLQPLAWSNCSLALMKENRKRWPAYCLQQRPQTSEMKSCGNGVVDVGEECDCGSPDLALVWSEVNKNVSSARPSCSLNCCDMNSCRFIRRNVTCATGDCCNFDTCQFEPKYRECRPARGDCDLPEYCSGSNEYCPRDLHKATGYSCKSMSEIEQDDGICFAGKCNSRTAQCKSLWGPSAYDSNPKCYEKNAYGNQAGNCGHSKLMYVSDNLGNDVVLKEKYDRCPTTADTFCGTVHCEGLPVSTTSAPLSIQVEFRENLGCTYMQAGMLPDFGLVYNGTKCLTSDNSDGICLANRCIAMNDTDSVIQATFEAEGLVDEYQSLTGEGKEFLSAIAGNCDCSTSRCFCNSVGSRHCNPGYEPPLCEDSGCGGSLESNSAGLCHREGALSTGAVIAIVVIVIVLVIAILVVICILVVGRRRLSEMWYHSRLYVEVEHLRDRFTNVQPTSGSKTDSSGFKRDVQGRRSARGPPGPAPRPNTDSSGGVEMQRHRPTTAPLNTFNQGGYSPPTNRRVISPPMQTGTPLRPPPPDIPRVVKPNVPPPPPPKPPASGVASVADDYVPSSVSEARLKFDQRAPAHTRTPPERKNIQRLPVDSSPVLQRQPILHKP